MQKILVTGGTGYIGSHTIVDLIQQGYSIVSVDNGINSDPSVLDKVAEMVGKEIIHFEGDLCDISLCKKIWHAHPDIVGIIHFAALKSVGESVDKPLLYFRNNIDSLINVLDLALQYGVKAFVFSSSCTVYGNVESSPVDENTPLQAAASPYGRTKQIGEQIMQDSLLNADMKGILLRYFNPAGAHPSGKIGENPSQVAQNLVPVITETAIGKRTKMMVYGSDYPTRDGSCVRDYIHVCDLARAHTLAMGRLLSGKQALSVDVFNLGIGQGLTVLEVIKAFEAESGISLNYEIGPRRSGDIGAIYSDNSKAQNVLGWSPQFTAQDIMRTAWTWEMERSKQ